MAFVLDEQIHIFLTKADIQNQFLINNLKKNKINNMADLKAFAEQLVNLTVKEVNELAEILKNEYGIEPAAAAVAVAAGPAAAAGAPAAEEKTSFDVMLKSAGANKLAVVKLVKELTSLDLKETKDIVDAAPSLDRKSVV